MDNNHQVLSNKQIYKRCVLANINRDNNLDNRLYEIWFFNRNYIYYISLTNFHTLVLLYFP